MFVDFNPFQGIRRLLTVCGLLVFLAMFAAIPASADVVGPCTGSVTIDGTTYDPSFDTADNPIVVPADRAGMRIPYSGSVTMANTNYLGAVGVVVGPVTVNVADWGLDENIDDTRATDPNAVYVLGSDFDNLVGLYQLSAFHDADGGNCHANAMVKLDGPVLSTPAGAGATGGAVITGLGMIAAGIKKKQT